MDWSDVVVVVAILGACCLSMCLSSAEASDTRYADAIRLEQQLKTLIIEHGELSAPCVPAKDLDRYSLSISQDPKTLTVRVTGGPEK